MLLSESQFKLAALIVKTKELVAFATDTACDETFEILAQFCRDITKETDRRKEQNYANMDLEELLNLSSPAGSCASFSSTFFPNFVLPLFSDCGAGQQEQEAARERRRRREDEPRF